MKGRLVRHARESIRAQLADSARTIAALDSQAALLEEMASKLVETYRSGGKLLTFGNGGSSCDAQNFADELVGRLRRNRPPLAAVALTVSQADLTSIGNDYGFDSVFARQLEAHARPGDAAVGISTSGNSPNVLKALETAGTLGLWRVGLTGQSGGKMKSLCDQCLCVPSPIVARIQEVHITVIQILCDLVEESLFPDAPKAH